MRFCGNCGARLTDSPGALSPAARSGLAGLSQDVMMGADLAERFRQAGLESAGQRRRVTILFADLVGFTTLSQQADSEDTYLLVQQVMQVLAQAVYRYDGMVDKFIGDGLMAIFGAPIAHENSAELAIRSALDMHTEIARLGHDIEARLESRLDQPLALHIGLNTGTVVVGGIGSSLMMNYTAIGDTVNLAARLQQVCTAGDILVSDTAYAEARPLFDFEPLPPVGLKGYTRPVPVYRVLAEKRRPGRIRGIDGLQAPLIGRQEEVDHLAAAGARLVESGTGGVVWIEGEAGIGKSRLTAEASVRLDPVKVRRLAGHCLLYRRSAAYWPFLDLLRGALGLAGGDAEGSGSRSTSDGPAGRAGGEAPSDPPPGPAEERLRLQLRTVINQRMAEKDRETLPFLEVFFSLAPSDPEGRRRVSLLDAAQLRRQIFLAIRDWLQAEARHKPLLLLLDDLHWADEASLELLAYLVPALQHDPVLWLLVSRPEREGMLGEQVDGLRRRMGSRFTELHLKNLTPGQSQALVSRLLGLPEEEAGPFAPLIQRAGGNPFYLEELIRMLIDSRLLTAGGGGWRLEPGAEGRLREVPATLQGLILARFDRLDEQPRRILQTAAVVGRSFEAGLLGAVLKQIEKPTLQRHLAVLEEREFITPLSGSPGSPVGEAQGNLSGEARPGPAGERYQFKHVLVSDAIYSTLLRADRRRLHTQVGEALERLYAGRFEEHAELLARHFGVGTRPDRALHYNLMAGQKSLRGFANPQARRYFEAALDLLEKAAFGPEQFRQAHTGYGDVLALSGDYPGARRHYLQALGNLVAPVGSAGSDPPNAAAIPMDDPSSAAEIVEKSLDKVSMPDPTRWLDLSRMCRKISSTFERQGEYDHAARFLALAHQAVTRPGWAIDPAWTGGEKPAVSPGYAPSLQDPVVEQAWILNDTGWIQSRRGDLEAAETCLLQALERVAGSGQDDLIASIYNRLGGVCYQADHLDRAAGYVQQSLLLRQKIGDINAVARSYNNLGLLGWKRGDWEQALAHFRQSVELHGSLGDIEGTIELHSNLGLLLLDRGDYDQAKAHLQQALENAGQIGHAYQTGLALLHFSRLHVLQEDWPAALEFSQRAQAVFEEIGAGEHQVDLLTYAGLAYLGLGRLDEAESAAAQALPAAPALPGRTPGGQPEQADDAGRARRLAGQIALRRGDPSGARSSFEASYQIFERIGNLIEQGRTGCALAEVLRGCGQGLEARKLLDEAQEIFTRLGAKPDLKKVKGLLSTLPPSG